MSLVTRATSTSHRSVAQIIPQIQPISSFSRLYFRMALFELLPAEDGKLGEDRRLVDAIEAGRTYTLQVVADPDSDRRTSEYPVTLISDLELFVQCRHGLVHTAMEPCLVRQTDALATTCEFPVEVDIGYNTEAVTIELSYRRAGSCHPVTPISRLELIGKDAWLQEHSPNHHVVLDESIQENVRILHVSPKSQTTLHVRSYWDEGFELDEIIVKPAESPVRFMRKAHRPQDIIDRIRERSADNPVNFESWLKRHFGKYAGRFCLIILDASDEYDMAWELVHICVEWKGETNTGKVQWEEVPIGALFPIVRWIPELQYHGDNLTLTVSETIVSGEVIAYLDPQSTTHIDVEKQMLAQFGAQALDTIEAFKGSIEEHLTNPALIYLGCHGQIIVDNDREQEFLLGSLSAEQQFSIFNLAGLRYRNPRGPRPLAIVNACHSAYTVRKEAIRYGLPITLLRRLARDFLGTIGWVDSSFAARFARALLAEAGGEGGISIALMLKDKRAMAFEQARLRKHDPQAWFDYLYTFMYVYYGNPYTYLRLLPTGSTKG